MEHSPPPFFKRGPAPLVRLFFFASLSLALLVIDVLFDRVLRRGLDTTARDGESEDEERGEASHAR